MKRCILSIIAALALTSSFAQSDFIQLKKNNKVIKSWFKGNDFYGQLKNGNWITAEIYKIQDDSLYLRPYVVRTYVNRLGLPFLDTTYYGLMAVHPGQLNAFPREDRGFGYVKNGWIFDIAGGGYLLLNVINTLSDKEPVFGSDNLPKIGIAAGVLAIGVVLGLTHKSTYIIGKKYRIEYINAKPS
ncbi:hypothetical protein [Parafilimonas sp.]|uniref:hypothetical protein n=1 Tax=Parafilimonas sp. TaxID=1969739 RepID=UPI003F7FBB2B